MGHSEICPEEKEDDFTAVKGILEKYISAGEPYILDIDLDFFSTQNPFRTLYENAGLYEILRELYRFQPPTDLTDNKVNECVSYRQAQLNELHAIFDHLNNGGSIETYPDQASTRLVGVAKVVEAVTAFYNDVEWDLIHDAGCTIDDTELPHHVTSRPILEKLINSTFNNLIQVIPGKPTMVTISRSSEDEYCPPEDVDFIENAVLAVLRKHYSPLSVTLAYQEEETDEESS